mmetsp:Transcript_36036/g.80206  ORF Transcript_36036/g.80206 Transcript_36036/m.80206 type:complete len:285 (-) Transcript_36036:916-1770(-)
MSADVTGSQPMQGQSPATGTASGGEGGGPSQEVRDALVAAVLKSLEDMQAHVFFEKALTSSDASGSGRVVIPKAIAEQYFPRLEQQNGLPVRAVDTRGREYTFKFRFWINNQVSRMYLLEGAGELHHAYKMSVGDVMVFAQKPDGTLVVAGRPATKGDVIKKAPVKRPSAKNADGTATKREPKPKRQATDSARPAAGAQPNKKKKSAGTYNSLLDMEPAVDGIFRAVPHGISTAPGGVNVGKHGRWVVTLNLSGELYQAFFDTQEDAVEAYNAAGASVSNPITA